MQIEPSYDDLAQELLARTKIDVHVCYQCGKCSAGCPTAGHMDLLPNKILRLSQLGCRKKIIASNTLWNCVSCGTCSSRCPKNIDILRLIDTFRNIAYKERHFPEHTDQGIFYSLFLKNIAHHGRLSELELGAFYNLKSGHVFKDITLFPGLLIDGKLKLLPENIKNHAYIKKLVKQVKREEQHS